MKFHHCLAPGKTHYGIDTWLRPSWWYSN